MCGWTPEGEILAVTSWRQAFDHHTHAYAVPPDGIPVANVRVRRYRGFCAHNQEAKAFLAEISTRRDSLMAILNETPQLEDRTRRNAAGYLGDFFEVAGSLPNDVS